MRERQKEAKQGERSGKGGNNDKICALFIDSRQRKREENQSQGGDTLGGRLVRKWDKVMGRRGRR